MRKVEIVLETRFKTSEDFLNYVAEQDVGFSYKGKNYPPRNIYGEPWTGSTKCGLAMLVNGFDVPIEITG